MKAPFNAVSSPRIPSGVGWVGVGLAVGMIIFSAAKKLAKGDYKRKRGTAKPETQPKAQMKHEPGKPTAAAAPKRPAAVAKPTPKPAAAKSVPATKSASPTGREEVTAQKTAATKATQSPPKKKLTKVSAAPKKTTPGVNTNPKNPRTQPG